MKNIVSITLIMLLIGCTYGHHKDVILEEESFNIERIEGSYSNAGISPGGRVSEKLSKFIFPDFDSHDRIEEIDVLVDSSRIICSGLQNGVEVIQKSFTNGEDFIFEGNKISLSKTLSCFDCNKTGAPHLAIGIKNYTLYLSKEGDAILRSNEKGVAVIVLLPYVPLPMYEEHDVLFKRIKKH